MLVTHWKAPATTWLLTPGSGECRAELRDPMQVYYQKVKCSLISHLLFLRQAGFLVTVVTITTNWEILVLDHKDADRRP